MKTRKKITARVSKLLEPLVPEYLRRRHQDVLDLSQAFSKGDYMTVGVLGHQMAGNGAGYGFNALSEIGRALEEAAELEDADAVGKKVEELREYLRQLVVVYEERP